MQTCYVAADDGYRLYTRIWTPSSPPRGIVHIAHGMSEHGGRYAAVAEALTEAGYAVYAHDHRGHGRTAETERDLGHFADAGGWAKVVDDIGAVQRRARRDHPGVPLFLVGHSMGSLLARSYAIEHSDLIDGLVLSGTAGSPGAMGRVGALVAKTEARLRGPRRPSTLMNKLTFGSFAGRFKPARTEFDWLSRDTEQVDAYIADPLCGRVPSAQFFVDLLTGVAQINDADQVAHMRPDLPIYLFSGGRDPVGDNGQGVRAVHDLYETVGIRDLTLLLYPDARHETFNELNRAQVVGDLIAWLNAHR